MPSGSKYMVQRTWSNAAAARMQNPCVPHTASTIPYFNSYPALNQIPYSSGTTMGVKIPIGQSKTIDVILSSTGATPGPWNVTVYDYDQNPGRRLQPVPGTLARQGQWTKRRHAPSDDHAAHGRPDARRGGVLHLLGVWDGGHPRLPEQLDDGDRHQLTLPVGFVTHSLFVKVSSVLPALPSKRVDRRRKAVRVKLPARVAASAPAGWSRRHSGDEDPRGSGSRQFGSRRRSERGKVSGSIGCLQMETTMRTAVVVARVLSEEALRVMLVAKENVVGTASADRPDHPLAERIRLR